MRIITIFCTLLFCLLTTAQINEPVKVKHQISQDNDIATITFDCTIDKGWHIYSTEKNEMLIATSIVIEEASGCELLGPLTPDGEKVTKYDELLKINVSYYEFQVRFTQKIKITSEQYAISGYLEYGACNDNSCLPPAAVNFTYNGNNKKTAQTTDSNPTPTPISQSTTQPLLIQPITVSNINTSNDDTLENELWKPVETSSLPTETQSRSLWIIFITSFFGGFIALLTPCVWPIIPMTVSFFMKRSKKKTKGIRDSLTYGLSIIVIYVSLGVAITAIAGPSALNALSTNAVFNIIFTVMLLLFGLSFLGAFELKLPTSWSNAVDRKAEKTTGLLSIFLMAFTLALVSFSCTGPIIGFLLVELTTSGSMVAPMVGMFGFALALALPFTLFALFPQMMRRMPRSGGWMETMKVMLGFVEIAFALKFLSVADLAYGWHILDRETFIVLWIAIAITAALYLWRVIKLHHDEDTEKIGTVRLIGGMACMTFAMYLIPGLWGAPLKAVSAFLPPMYTQDFVLDKNIPQSHYLDFEEGMEAAKKQNKPALIDFTGYGCVNCREMEASVWTDPQVAQMINNDFVLISLYVDDKTPLEKKIIVKENEKETTLRTIGDKWSYLQRYKFGVNAQPYYVILDNDGNLIGKPHHYDLDINNFVTFLNNGKR